MATREQEPLRFRRARSSARLSSVQETIEEMLGLPSGCIRFTTPTGRTVRSDTLVKTLRQHWGE